MWSLRKFAYLSNNLALSALLVLSAGVAAQAPKIGSESANLKRCWTSAVDGSQVKFLLAEKDLLFAATSDGKLRAHNIADGTPAWTVEMGGEFVSNILPTASDVILVSNSSGESKQSTIRSISKQTGVAHWRAELTYSQEFYLGGDTPTEITSVSSAGSVVGISVADGTTLWKADVGVVTTKPSFAAGKALIPTASGDSYSVVRLGRGDVELRMSSKWKPTAVEFLDDGKLVVGDDRGNITAYNVDGIKDWSFKNGASISNLVQTEQGLLAASNDNFLYMLTENRGGVIWKRRLSGRIALAPNLLNGSIFAITYGDGRGYLLSSEKGKVIDQSMDEGKEFTPNAAVQSDGRLAVAIQGGFAVSSVSGCSR